MRAEVDLMPRAVDDSCIGLREVDLGAEPRPRRHRGVSAPALDATVGEQRAREPLPAIR